MDRWVGYDRVVARFGLEVRPECKQARRGLLYMRKSGGSYYISISISMSIDIHIDRHIDTKM